MQHPVSRSQPSCCNIPSQLVATSVSTCCNIHLNLLQHPVSTCCNIPSQLVATPVSSCCNTPSQPCCKTSQFGSITVLQHPISTHHVVTPHLNLLRCNTVSTLATPHLNPPRCNTWSQPAALQYPTHHVAIHPLNVQCSTIVLQRRFDLFRGNICLQFLKIITWSLFALPSAFSFLLPPLKGPALCRTQQINPEVRDGMSMMCY